MFLLLMITWFALGAVTMVVVAALGRAGKMQDQRRAAAVTGTVPAAGARQPVPQAA